MTETTLDKICSAIDLITEKRIQGLEFDRTISATIINADNSKDGEYTVNDGSSSFFAYSENTNYKVDEQVYVTIPNGDFNKQKWILGKADGENNTPITYLYPFDSYFDMTGNLVNIPREYSLLANDPDVLYKEIKNIDNSNQFIINPEFIGYDLLGIKADFKSFIPTAITGNYGLIFKLEFTKLNTNNNSIDSHTSATAILDSADMYGNPYNFGNYFNQQLVLDISAYTEEYRLDKIAITFYQGENFLVANNQKLDYTISGGNEKLFDNLFVNNIYVSLGYKASNEESVKIYTNQDKYYDENNKSKNIRLRWCHLVEVNNSTQGVAIFDNDTLNKWITDKEVNIYWYRYNKKSSDNLLGKGWEKIEDFNQSFNINIELDESIPSDAVRAVVELIDNEGIDNYTKQYNTNKTQLETAINNNQARISELEKENEELENRNSVSGSLIYLSTIEENEAKIEALKEENIRLNNQLKKIILDTTEFYTYYRSNILEFSNTDKLIDDRANLFDSITMSVEDGGVYRVYDSLTNTIISGESRSTKRNLVLTFADVFHDSKHKLKIKPKRIQWIFPIDNTMIECPSPVVSTDSLEEKVEIKGIKEGDYYIVDCANPNLTTINNGSEYYSVYKCPFNIKTHLMQTNTNNRVRAKVFIDKYDSEYSVDLIFGPIGQQGTNNTLIISSGNEYIYQNTNYKVYDNLSDVQYEQHVAIREYNLNAMPTGNYIIYCKLNNNWVKDKTISGNAGATSINYERILVEENPIAWTVGSSTLIDLTATLCDANDNIIKLTSDNKVEWSFRYKHSANQYYFSDQRIEDGKAKIRIGANTNTKDGCIIVCKINLNSIIPNFSPAKTYDPNSDTDYYDSAYNKVDKELINIENYQNYYVKDTNTCTEYISYFVLPARTSREYNKFTGADRIIYSASNGSSPKYYNSAYVINNLNIKAQITNYENNSYVNSNSTYYPTIKDNNILVPKSMYLNNLNYDIQVNLLNNGNIIWRQPLLILNNQWSSSVLNNWDGNFKVDPEGGTILGTMFGAGRKDRENRFSGVLMGDVSLGAKDTSAGLGVYGYQEGEQSFGLNINGRAFIGKSSTAQFIFDGNTGVLQNAGYKYGTGIKLSMSGLDTDEQSISIKRRNANTGKEVEYVKLSSGVSNRNNNTYLQVRSQNNNPLLHIGEDNNGNSKYYLQSDGYTDDNRVNGTKIDLSSGLLRIKSTNSNNQFIDISTKTTDAPVNVNGNFKINWDGSFSASNSKFKVDADGTITSTAGKIGGWTIGDSTLTGGNTTLNSNGTINCSDLIANNTGSIGGWSITSSTLEGGNTILNSDGTITCDNLIATNSGKIGNFTIERDKLSGGTISGGYIYGGSININDKFKINTGTTRFGEIDGLNIGSGGLVVASPGAAINGGMVVYDGVYECGIFKGWPGYEAKEIGFRRVTGVKVTGYTNKTVNISSAGAINGSGTVSVPSQFDIEYDVLWLKFCGGILVGYRDSSTPEYGSSSSPGGCFAPGTKILMSNRTYKNIEEIKINDKVMTYNENATIFEPGIVSNIMIHHNTTEIIELVFEDNTSITMTKCHPILTTEGWKSLNYKVALYEHKIETEEIKIGQYVLTTEGLKKIVNIIEKDMGLNYDTYNITVPHNNTYIANSAIVHNAVNKQG